MMAVPEASCHSAHVALSGALVIWGPASAALAARELMEGRATHRRTFAAGSVAAALLVFGAVWYFPGIPWTATCPMWPFAIV